MRWIKLGGSRHALQIDGVIKATVQKDAVHMGASYNIWEIVGEKGGHSTLRDAKRSAERRNGCHPDQQTP